MPVPPYLKCIRAAFLSLACSASLLSAAATSPDPAYGWKLGEVYRYDFHKSIQIDETSTDADSGTMAYVFDGVLILEVTGKATNGVAALLRFDTPKISLPDAYWFSAASDEPVVQKEKSRAVERAMENAIKIPRWKVVLQFDGTIHIDSRDPKTIEECFKAPEQAGTWRQKYRKVWSEIVEQNLGLVASGDEREIVLALSKPQQVPLGEAAKIRTFRSPATFVASKDERADYSFERLAPPQAGTPYTIPAVGPPNVTMTVSPKIKNTKGIAWFDTKLNILDKLSEEFEFDADYQCKVDARKSYALHQHVKVNYELTRRSKHKPPDEVDAR